MACQECDALIEYQGNGVQRRYTFPFEYYERSEINVSVFDPEQKKYVEWKEGAGVNEWFLVNPTTISIGTPTKEKIRIYRCTDVDAMRAIYTSGSAIKAKDLNDDFEQLLHGVEEARCWSNANIERTDYGYNIFLNRIPVDETDEEYGFKGDLVTSRSRLVVNDDVVGTTKWIDNRYWNVCEDTLLSGNTWISDNDHIATSKSVDQRINELIAQGGGGDDTPAGVTRITAGSNITISPSGGTGVVTINAVDNKLESVNASAPIIGSLSNNSLTLSFNMASLPTR